KTTSSQLINMISLERKTSSPAAPPPSFSERTYREQLALTSMGKKRKSLEKKRAPKFRKIINTLAASTSSGQIFPELRLHF
ncbi:hypothetical protein, partial [Agrobacterium tumefaciens]|uniref:hypothetical protein n=1 Tax=Agrobacterium tumefaciens TaxID=358 RepID=UPI001B89E9C3